MYCLGDWICLTTSVNDVKDSNDTLNLCDEGGFK